MAAPDRTKWLRGMLVGAALVALLAALALAPLWRGSAHRHGTGTQSGTAAGTPTPAASAPAGSATPGSAAEPVTTPSLFGQPMPADVRAAAASLPAVAPIRCAATVTVSSARELQAALRAAQPGDVIRLANGVYTGQFTASAHGTQAHPITLCGSRRAVLDGGGIEPVSGSGMGGGRYALHLDGAAWWVVSGFTVRDAQKGVMVDATEHTVIAGLDVYGIGDEAIHLRDNSSYDTVEGNLVHRTGLRRDKYGEGLYVGSANSNWCDITGCDVPDRADHNALRGNVVWDTSAEAVDIKEGTTGGQVVGNVFDGSAMTGSHADSWVDVKGNDFVVRGNVGFRSPEDGFQTHMILPGWGDNNVFAANVAHVDGPGYGFHFAPELSNVANCDNRVTGAASGAFKYPCSADQ